MFSPCFITFTHVKNLNNSTTVQQSMWHGCVTACVTYLIHIKLFLLHFQVNIVQWCKTLNITLNVYDEVQDKVWHIKTKIEELYKQDFFSGLKIMFSLLSKKTFSSMRHLNLTLYLQHAATRRSHRVMAEHRH